MKMSDRRCFLKTTAVAAAAAMTIGGAAPVVPAPDARPKRKFTLCLACGPIGVRDEPSKAIARAREFGFESIEPSPQFLANLSDGELGDYLGQMRDAKLVWGAAGLPVQFRRDDAAFTADLESLPAKAKGLQRAGATRMATWLSPGPTP